MSIDNLPITDSVSPTDVAGVSAAICAAGQNATPVYPLGGGTMLHEGAMPSRPGIGLSLAKLNRLIDYPAADLTVTVEAGMTVAELQHLLAANRQRLPIDVPHPQPATVGGAMAANCAGPRRLAYGTMRDYLLGFTAVDGTGTVFSGGGRVVKNAAGYNMCRLMAGSLGTLGVFTQLTLMVRPCPETSALVACDLPDLATAEKLLAGLTHSPVRPVAVELLAGHRLDGSPVLGPALEGSAGRLYVGFEGSTAEVEWMVVRLKADWAAAGINTPVLAASPAVEQHWHWLAQCPTAARLNVLPSTVAETIEQLLQREPGCAIQAHAGDGVICVDSPNSRELTLPGCRNNSDTPDVPDAKIRLLQAIKERFDPQNILNPGRLPY